MKKVRLLILLAGVWLVSGNNGWAQPVITSFSPTSGSSGTLVTINGSGFNTAIDRNIVRFGAVSGNVTSASATQIKVIVPPGAIYCPISVTNLTTALTGISTALFLPLEATQNSLTSAGSNAYDTFGYTTTGVALKGILGDMDGDGKSDIVTMSKTANKIAILKNSISSASSALDASSFSSSASITASAPEDVIAEDINGDGKLDIITCNNSNDNLYIYLNASSGGTISFQSAQSFSTGGGPTSIAAADLNADGKMDLVVTDYSGNNLTVLKNTSSGSTLSFSATTSSFGNGSLNGPNYVKLADIDKDGKIDMLVTDKGSGSADHLYVYANGSSGSSISFSLSSTISFSGSDEPSCIALSDLDHDGDADVLVSFDGASHFTVAPNTSSSGSISFASAFNAGAYASASIAAADVDGDDLPEVILIQSGNSIAIYPNNYSGTLSSSSFGSVVSFTSGNNTEWVVAGSLNGDAKPDLVGIYANNGVNRALVFRNKMTTSGNPLSGTYTIGSTGDFSTFSQAVASMTSLGVNGPVRFKIQNGTYYERLWIPSIFGSSSTNTISFESLSGNNSDVTLSYPSTTDDGSNYIVYLDEASHMTFKNMTLDRTDSNAYGQVFLIGGAAQSDSIFNCAVNGSRLASASSNANIIASGTSDNSSLAIANNTFMYGNIGIYLTGTSSTHESGNVIKSNTFDSNYISYIQAFYNDGITISGNTMSNLLSSAGKGIYLSDCDNQLTIYRNNLTCSNDVQYGLQAENCTASSSAQSLFANNVIGVKGTSGSVLLTNCEQVKLFSNSIGEFGSTTGFAFKADGGSFTSYNNVFYNKTGGYAIQAANSPSVTSNYNLLYTEGSTSTLADYNGTSCLNLSSWQSTSTEDANSVSASPYSAPSVSMVPSASDTLSWYVNGMGKQLPSDVTEDLAGNPRAVALSDGAPDLGAYEITPSVNSPRLQRTGGNVAIGNTSYFYFGGKLAVALTFDSGSVAPTSLFAHFYPGGTAPNISANSNHFYCYWQVEATGGTSYYYTAKFYYDSAQTGTVYLPNLRAAKNPSSTITWIVDSNAQNNNYLVYAPGSSFSTFTGTDNISPVPVTWSSFDASLKNENTVGLHWSTASEMNNDHFVVERSTDGWHWITISTLKGSGWSYSVKNYFYDDRLGKEYYPLLYYRIKQVDKNGRFDYSATRKVYPSHTAVTGINAWYNSSNRNLQLEMSSETDAQDELLIYGMDGRIYLQKKLDLRQGNNEFSEDLSSLNSGVYLMQLKADGHTEVRKFVKY